ncbi:MAG: flagellar hook basal-body protein [Planctomycetes bacterium]|nr:flagellar hook basal-body protein [Planctomycetota bacterium]
MDYSLHAAQNGILATTQYQSIIANNLANITTPAFKRGRQEQADFRLPGTQVAATPTDFRQGAIQKTGRDLDLAINGDGFFKIDLSGTEVYTRSGAFRVDRDGNLVTNQGLMVSPQITIPQNTIRVEAGSDGSLFAITDLEGTATQVGQIEVVRFQNSMGLIPIGDNLFREGPDSGPPITGQFGEIGFPTLMGRSLEESNVELAEELTQELITQRVFQANLRAFRTSDQIIGETINITR